MSGGQGAGHGGQPGTATATVDPESGRADPDPLRPPTLKRYHGSVSLDPTRVGSDAGRIAEEVIAHLAGLLDANVEVTLEIEAMIPTGVPENVVRIVTENSRTLKFKSHEFEVE